ncbi:MAG: hypothetical protein ACRDST_17935 [Pseudonocardiaceae bacterium]
MLLRDAVEVAATRSRSAKGQSLAALLSAATDPGELGLVVGFLTGEPRQGRLGIGWFTATPDEQRFLIGLCTGELRQGALEGVMLEAVASAAGVPAAAVRRAFMLCARLPDTAVAAMAGGETALGTFRLEVGRPVCLMLAAPADSLDAALAELGKVSVEYKLDGARIQVHRDGEAVQVWTRTLREITSSVPELVALVRGLPCSSVVLDGETLALTDDGRPPPFQETMSILGAADGSGLQCGFFDCLHLDGRDLLDTPLAERLTALEAVAERYRIPSVQQADMAVELFDAALAAGHEGVMVKSLHAPYSAGRRGRAWQKVKPVHTLDLVAFELAKGRPRTALGRETAPRRRTLSSSDSCWWRIVFTRYGAAIARQLVVPNPTLLSGGRVAHESPRPTVSGRVTEVIGTLIVHTLTRLDTAIARTTAQGHCIGREVHPGLIVLVWIAEAA